MIALTNLIDKLSSYLIIGMMNTVICLLVMYLGSNFGLDYLYYTAMGYLIGIILSFFLNLHFTFQVKGKLFKRLFLFVIISFFNLLLVELIEYTLIESFNWNRFLAIFCGMAWYVITGFILNNFWVYRQGLRP
jgi:putative flippase GtrA